MQLNEVVRPPEARVRHETEGGVRRLSSGHGSTRRTTAPSRGVDTGTSDLLYLTLLFGVWLAVVASVICISVWREAGGRWTPRVRTLTRLNFAVGVVLVVAYLSVALAAFQFVPMDTSYSIIVAAFAAAVAVQGVQFGLSMVRARRLRVAGSQAA